jgi:hypothetical protein
VLGLQKELTRLYFWIVLVSGLGVWGFSWYLMSQNEGQGWEDWYAFAASLGASAIWWAALSRVAENQILRLVRLQLNEEQSAAQESRDKQVALLVADRDAAEETRQMELELLKAELERFSLGEELPAAIYEGKIGWDLRFNRDLTAHLAASKRYVFRGPTGIHVGARLHHRTATRPLALVEVTITDPTSKPAMAYAVRDRKKRSVHAPKPDKTVEDQLRDDIYMALIGLFDARTKAKSVHVVHDRRATRVRAELFDGALYDSIVDTAERANFTHTLRWDRGQSTYHAREAILRGRGEVKHWITLRTETTEEELRAHLKALGMAPDRLEELRERFKRIYLVRLGRVLTSSVEFSDEMHEDE